MATHSSILAWKIPWTKKPGGLWSVGLQRVGHNWATNTFIFLNTEIYFDRRWKTIYHGIPSMGSQEKTRARSPFTSTMLHEKPHLVAIIVVWFCSAWQLRRHGIDTAAVPLDWWCFKLRTALIVSGGFQRQPLHVHRVDRTASGHPRMHSSQSGSASHWGWVRFKDPGGHL